MERLLVDYRRWLVAERGLAEATVIRYENLARRFLQLHWVGERVEVAALTGAEVVAFLLRECERVCVGSAKGRVAELRSLLTFLFVRGLTPRLLTTAVPPVAGWRETGIPKALPAGHVQRLLDSCDGGDPVGPRLRDYDAGRAAGAALDRGRAAGAGRRRLARRPDRRARQGVP